MKPTLKFKTNLYFPTSENAYHLLCVIEHTFALGISKWLFLDMPTRYKTTRLDTYLDQQPVGDMTEFFNKTVKCTINKQPVKKNSTF